MRAWLQLPAAAKSRRAASTYQHWQRLTALFSAPPSYVRCSAAGGVKGSEHVTELHSREDLDRFVSSQEERVLTVVNLSISSADPCIHIFPAVLALARSFKGYAAFGR
jgi:hypothetical protein